MFYTYRLHTSLQRVTDTRDQIVKLLIVRNKFTFTGF